MASKSFLTGGAAEATIFDVSDLIFRRNCVDYFSAKRNVDIDTTKASSIREFNPAPLGKTAKDVFAVIDEKLKIKVIPTPEDVRKISEDDIAKELNAEAPSHDQELPDVQKSEGSQSQTEMVLTFDATPTRVGGLLRLPENERTIFYYSVSWTTHFEFDDSTKFEMVNAALALELFQPYLNAYRERYDKLIVKTDNNFYGSIKGFKDPLDVKFLMGVRNKVKCLRGEFRHVCVSQKDADIQNADYLSRTELPIGLKIEYVESSSREGKAASYALVDLSAVARDHTLYVIKEYVPGKYIIDH